MMKIHKKLKTTANSKVLIKDQETKRAKRETNMKMLKGQLDLKLTLLYADIGLIISAKYANKILKEIKIIRSEKRARWQAGNLSIAAPVQSGELSRAEDERGRLSREQ
jgi:hypothetical protein